VFFGFLSVFGGVFWFVLVLFGAEWLLFCWGVSVDAGNEFGCCLHVFCVLVAVFLDQRFFFVSYPVVEGGYAGEGLEESWETVGVYGDGDGAEEYAGVDRVSDVAVDAVGDEGVALPYPQGPRVVAFQCRLCGDPDQESGCEEGCPGDVGGGFQGDEGCLEVPE